MYEKSYGTARLVLGIVAIAGWVVIVIGLIAVVSSIGTRGGPNWQVTMPGIIILASGLVLVATSQVSFAVLDQADISRANLLVQRKIAEAQGVSLQSQDTTPTASMGSTRRSDPTIWLDDKGDEHREYMGNEIIKRNNRYYVGGQDFITLGKAKAAIKNGQV